VKQIFIRYNSEEVLMEEKYILKRKRGTISPTRGGGDADAANQQLVEIPDSDISSRGSSSDRLLCPKLIQTVFQPDVAM
jgi:hypothetical protein